MTAPGKETVPKHAPLSVFWTFLRLGLIGFGGPTAHLALFREVLVRRAGWASERAYDEVMALCQFLPGPASSQTAAALGWMRAGPAGAWAALAGFALPSVILMGLAGYGATRYAALLPAGVLTGLLAAAAAVVAAALWSMGQSLIKTRAAALIAAFGFAGSFAVGVAELPLAALQPIVIGLAAFIGALALRPAPEALAAGPAMPRSRMRGALVALGLFAVLLVILPLLAGQGRALALADAVYRSGALVFGGGHVVLPLLDANTVPDLIDRETFLAGYGLAQTLPGPLFSFAAFIGAAAGQGPAGALVFAGIGAVAVFAPGLLLVFAVLPAWARLKSSPVAAGALAGAAAAVTGVLAAAFIDPVLTSLPVDVRAYALAAAAFLALRIFNAPAPLVVAACAGIGALAL